MQLMIAALTLPLVPGLPQVIIPAGTFSATNGSLKGQEGPWVLSDADGIALVDQANSGTDIVVDYEHQTILSAQNGQPAPAAGWLLAGGFVWQPDVGVVATDTRWTTEAAKMIQEGEYRFLSPVFSYTADGVPVMLLSVALTNTPALTTLQELSIAANNRGCFMPEQPITPVVNQATPQATVALKVVTEPTVAALSHNQSAAPPSHIENAHPMIAMLTAQLVSAREETARVNAKYAELQMQLADGTRQALITAALSDGRLLPQMVVWASNIPLGDLQEFLNTSKPIAALTSTQTKGMPPKTSAAKTHGLNNDEIAVCKQLNIDHERFVAQRNALEQK